MTKKEANDLFIKEVYGDIKNFRKAKKDDYCAVQFSWSCFMDALNRNGDITDKQLYEIQLPK